MLKDESKNNNVLDIRLDDFITRISAFNFVQFSILFLLFQICRCLNIILKFAHSLSKFERTHVYESTWSHLQLHFSQLSILSLSPFVCPHP